MLEDDESGPSPQNSREILSGSSDGGNFGGTVSPVALGYLVSWTNRNLILEGPWPVAQRLEHCPATPRLQVRSPVGAHPRTNK